MKLHPGKKIEIICEGSVTRKVFAAISKAGGRGYTVVPILHGQGDSGYSHEALLDESTSNVKIVTIVNAEVAEKVLEAVFPILEKYSGIVYQMDVEFFRPERF